MQIIKMKLKQKLWNGACIYIGLCLYFFDSLGVLFLDSFNVKVELMNTSLIFLFKIVFNVFSHQNIFSKFSFCSHALAIKGIIYSLELTMINVRSIVRNLNCYFCSFVHRKISYERTNEQTNKCDCSWKTAIIYTFIGKL